MDKHQENSNASKDTQAPKDFTPPRHWIGPEELSPNYWNDPKVKEKRAQEFYEKPVEWVDQMDRLDKQGVVRREFLTIMGASMAMASFACARRPVHKIIPYVVQPEEITPGVANWYASTCKDCEAQCGVLVKTREGRPIKVEGNPEHPLNQGSLCAKGQASVLNLYDTDRLKAPLLRSRDSMQAKEISWEAADAAILSKLKSSARVRVLTGALASPSTQALIQEFLSAFPQGKQVEYEPLHLEEVPQSQELSYGTALIPHYQLDRAEVIVSLGADFLTHWISSVEKSRQWAKGRKLTHQNPAQARLSKLIAYEPTITVTGANADERYAIRPGDELKIALALANELIVHQKRSTFASDPMVAQVLSGYTPERVAQEIRLRGGAEQLRAVAELLWQNRGKSLVLGGSIQSKTSDALSLQIAINLLNSALDNEGQTVDGVSRTQSSSASFSAFKQLLAEMKAGQVDVLIVHRTNPAYVLPRALLGLLDAFKRVPLVVSISEQDDETAQLADYVLPDHHFLENWGDGNPQKGIYSLQQPTIAPIHSTRAFEDSLIQWIKGAHLKVAGYASRAEDWHDYLRNHWKETTYRQSASIGSFDQFWEGVLRSGVLDLSASAGNSVVKTVQRRPFRVASLSRLPQYHAVAGEESFLCLYPKVSMGDGRNANNAWLQEMPDPISSVTWDNYVNISPKLAQQLNLQEDDVVEVNSGDVQAQLPVNIQPGLHPSVVSVAIGYGRRNVGKVGNFAGVDVFPFLQVSKEGLCYSGQRVTLKKTGKFYKLASTQWHTATEERPIINDITLKEFRKNPASANHTDPHLRMETVPTIWPVHEYSSYRWGMAIDLNACTGCGACVIACQAENNIPVVGRDQVRVSRQMHWIKIDRYYSGSPDEPNVIFQPMLCQHCENASCETVCPVLATVHDDEGLNVQVYNRCVGTRYCQNNCPYKVRRFNFFDHWKSYEGTMNLAWNPDVTVRTRGIMEKCTFCVQRIHDAKDHAKDAGERVKDGDFQVACQQTCPTEAIVFGDMNDPKSRVSKMKESPQAFRVLEILNNKPSISYMTKVRNQTEGAHSAEHHV